MEDLTPGCQVRGLHGTGPVKVVQVEWHGTSAVTVKYRDAAGRVDDALLYRDDETRLTVDAPGRAWSFDADPYLFRLVSEALRIRLAYLFDPFLAVTTSNIEPLPHQIQAVYGEMLPRQPMRFLLADDPGAGKTIMAGLYIKELIIRGDVERCMIVAPGSLVEQWQDELWYKFGLDFKIISRETIENSRSGNPFAELDRIIVRIDQVARDDELLAKLEQTDWDLVVADEAHKMAAHWFGSKLEKTKRYQLGERLGARARHLLLMTATPHSGKDEDFQLFMALLDADRFEGRFRDGTHTVDVSDLMRRLVKEKLLKFDGKPLFPPRRAYTAKYRLSDLEAGLYTAVTDYVREEMGRAERLQREGEGRRGTIVGFALTTLQRRLASSPEAIYQSLRRRRERLESRLREADLAQRTGARVDTLSDLGVTERDIDDIDDAPDAEVEEIEERVVDQASTAATVEELRAEIDTLRRLEAEARKVRSVESDRKWEELSKLLQSPIMFNADRRRRKIIVFTEHRDTLNYLTDRIRRLLGKPEAVTTIHGGMGREERRKSQEVFTQDKDCSVLVATDAAGEGINLQRATLVMNYDLPWNPNRIEQRFGRVHRIGQTEVCHMWNLVAEETREGDVFLRLFDKLEAQRATLGDQVFDVLGSAFAERPLRDLLLEAIKYGERPEVKRHLDQVIDETVGDRLRDLTSERALASDVLGPTDIEHIRERMEEAQARKLQPHFIRSFFMEAFTHLGGRIAEREPERYEITHVPADIRARDRLIGTGMSVMRRYERVVFDKEHVSLQGKPLAQFVCPGHPLLDATVDLILERYRSLLKHGAVLIDPADETERVRVLVYLEHAIQDGRTDRGTRRVASKRLQFVEITQDGTAWEAGYAPYLDYRPPDADESALVKPLLEEAWLEEDLDALGVVYAIEHAVPAHLEEVRSRTTGRVEKTMRAVHERLTKEIIYWDHRATELKAEEQAGKQPKMNSDRARQRAEDLQARLNRRIEELKLEKEFSALPPQVLGGAIVVPAGRLARLRGERAASPADYEDLRDRTERLAVDAVLAAERALGREPVEMPRNNPGFDIRSKDPSDGTIYFIEVKGRKDDATTVCVTRTEILTALNKPDQFILALVNVDDGGATDPLYVRRPFPGTEEAFFPTTSVNYAWKDLIDKSYRPSGLVR